jgi:phenylacetate-CoA ligase
MLALQWQFERTQWWSPERLLERQFHQLRILAAHAAEQCAFYAGLRARLDSLTPRSYKEWPRVTKRMVQDNHDGLRARSFPSSHGRAGETFTSGSTAAPMRVLVSETAQLFALAAVVRDHLWHAREFGAKFAAIRFMVNEGAQDGWSPGTNAAFPTGPAVFNDVTVDVALQMEWLLREGPAYLLAPPSYLRALLAHSKDSGRVPFGLKQVITYAEALPEGLRESVAALWQAKLVDSYSCRELGSIALQCPEAGQYHVQSENVYLEILREDGSPCEPGESGRVVVTPLHNFAMPLLRYELGDFATLGAPCSCGRGLPVLRAILGRVRNMARDPNGRLFQPTLDVALREVFVDVAVRQVQVIQHALGELEVLYVRDSELSPRDAERVRASINEQLRYPFDIRLSRVESIARSASGKYESFISRVLDA